MSDVCMVFNAATEFSGFIDKYKDLAKNLGNNCAILGGLAGMMPDMPNLGKELKESLATLTNAANAIYDKIKEVASGITAAGMAVLNQLVSGMNAAFDLMQSCIDQINAMIDTALNAVKMATCPLLLNSIKQMSGDIANLAASTGAVKAYEFAKGVNGSSLVGKMDIDALARDALSKSGVNDIINNVASVKSQAQGFLNQASNLAQFKCTP